MRKIILALCLLVSMSINAEKKPFGNGLFWDLNSSGVLTISGNGAIPNYGVYWNQPWYNKGIKKVIIENGVTAIGERAFEENYKDNTLLSVVIPSSVKTIGANAFCQCKLLSSVSIANSVTTIGEGAFFLCEKLSSIKLPNSLRTIEDDAFLATGLTSVIIPNSVKSIGNAAFGDCFKLSLISIPNSVKSIGEDAFIRADGEDDDECFKGTIVSMPQWLLDKGKEGWAYCRLSESSVNEFKRNNTPDKVVKRNGGYASAVEMKNGSTKYYKVSKGGRYGLTDAYGKVIVPCEMEALESAGTGYLKYKVNGFWGVMNYTGKIIIPTDRGYTRIGDYVSFTKRFAYEMDGWKGECNNLGVQVSKIKVNTPKQTIAKQKTKLDTPTPKKQEEEKKIIIEHHRDPIPVQEWQTCTNCWGEGRVMCGGACGGTGTYYAGDRLFRCSSCGGTGKKICPYCGGQGGKNVTVYR